MAKQEKDLIYDTKGAVLKAQALGFYKIKGLAAKSGRCRHISCGATKPMSGCWYLNSVKEHESRVKSGFIWGNTVYTPEAIALAVSRLNNIKTDHVGCADDWCVRSSGKPRPDNLDQMVACSRHHLEQYTSAELSKPDVKPESIAVEMHIALLDSHRGIDMAIGLYDLIDDKWFNDKWWMLVGWKNNNLMPHDKNKEYPAPKELVNVDEVIAALKASL